MTTLVVDPNKYKTRQFQVIDNNSFTLPYQNPNECIDKCDQDIYCASFDAEIDPAAGGLICRLSYTNNNYINRPTSWPTTHKVLNQSVYEKINHSVPGYNYVDWSENYCFEMPSRISNTLFTNKKDCAISCDNNPNCRAFRYNSDIDYRECSLYNDDVLNPLSPICDGNGSSLKTQLYKKITTEENPNILTFDTTKYIEKKGVVVDVPTSKSSFVYPNECIIKCDQDPFCLSVTAKKINNTNECHLSNKKGHYFTLPQDQTQQLAAGVKYFNDAAYEKIGNSAPNYDEYNGPYQSRLLNPYDSNTITSFTTTSFDDCKKLCGDACGGFTFHQNGTCDVVGKLRGLGGYDDVYGSNIFSYIKKVDTTDKVTNTTGYKIMPNLFINGQKIYLDEASFTTAQYYKTAQDCLDKCTQHEECVSTQIDKSYGTCFYSNSINVKQDDPTKYANASSYQKINPYPSQDGYQGPNLNRVCSQDTLSYRNDNVNSLSKCKNFCDNLRGYCACFDFNINDKSCTISRHKELYGLDSPDSLGYIKNNVPPIEIEFTDESQFLRKPGQRFHTGVEDHYNDPQECLDRCLLDDECKAVSVSIFGPGGHGPDKLCEYSGTIRSDETNNPYTYSFVKKNLYKPIDKYDGPKVNFRPNGWYASETVNNLVECTKKCDDDVNCFGFSYNRNKECGLTRTDEGYDDPNGEESIYYTKKNNAYNITQTDGYNVIPTDRVLDDLQSEDWILSPNECLENCTKNPLCNSVQAGKLGSQTGNKCIYGISQTTYDHPSYDFVGKNAYVKINPTMDIKGYKRLPNTKLHGMSHTIPYKTPQECFDKCDEEEDCKLVEVNLKGSSSGQICSFSNMAEDFDFSNDSYRNILFGSVYQKSVLFPEFEGYNFVESGGKKQGNRLMFQKKSVNKTTLKSCIDYCTSEPDCKVVEYSKKNQTCTINDIAGQYIAGDSTHDEIIYEKSLPKYPTYNGPLLDKFLVQPYDLNKNIKNIPDCKKFCDKTIECKSFSVAPYDGCFYSSKAETSTSGGEVVYTKIPKTPVDPPVEGGSTPPSTTDKIVNKTSDMLKTKNKTIIIAVLIVIGFIVLMIFGVIIALFIKMIRR